MTGRSAVTRPPGESSQPSSLRRTGSRLAMATTVTLLLTYPTLTGQTNRRSGLPQRGRPRPTGQGEAVPPAGAGDVVGEAGGLVVTDGDGEDVVGVADTVGVGLGEGDEVVGVGVGVGVAEWCAAGMWCAAEVLPVAGPIRFNI